MSLPLDSQAERNFSAAAPFCSVQAPVGVGPTHVPQRTDSKVSLIQKDPHRHTQNDI